MGRATFYRQIIAVLVDVFQSTPSVGRATASKYIREVRLIISIHALRGEGDRTFSQTSAMLKHFNPRPPWGGRPQAYMCYASRRTNFNPRPPWGGRLDRRKKSNRKSNISIHALRGEGDDSVELDESGKIKFQSTPSVGRATIDSSRLAARWQNFNPRPPWGGRLNPDIASNGYYNFNPRPPWGGRPYLLNK